MAKNLITFSRIVGGIADYNKESIIPDGVAFIRCIDYRTDPRRWTLLPKALKESGTVVEDLPKWGERVVDDVYVYGDAGNIYKRTLSGVVTLERTVADAHGNGLVYYGEDGFLYYATDTSLGRLGQFPTTTPSFSDDFLGAEGGVPLNTYSLDLEASSSRYATAADSASLSQVGDITIETNVKFESLPAVGAEMVMVGKWNELSDERSYKFVMTAISGYFGDGSDGALTISSNTTEAPIDSSAVGILGAYTLTATNASFAAGQIILIHQTRGDSAGTWQRNTISSYTAGTITLQNALNFSYATSSDEAAQVRVLKQYTNVTINTAITYTTKAWNGTVGGIIAFLANGTITVTGTLSANGTTASTSSVADGATLTGATGGGFRGGTLNT